MNTGHRQSGEGKLWRFIAKYGGWRWRGVERRWNLAGAEDRWEMAAAGARKDDGDGGADVVRGKEGRSVWLAATVGGNRVQILCYWYFSRFFWYPYLTWLFLFLTFYFYSLHLITHILHILLRTFSKQARYLSLNAFAFLAAQDALPTQNVTSWLSGNETQQSTSFLVCLGTARTNPADSTLKFKSLCIILLWPSVQLA